MIVTIEWMEEWFRRFDQEYFGGKLPVPELGLTHAKTRLGQLAYKRASRWGRTKLYDFKLSMSTYYDMTDKQAKSVLLHEMIHYIIGYTGLKDTSAHGVVSESQGQGIYRSGMEECFTIPQLLSLAAKRPFPPGRARLHPSDHDHAEHLRGCWNG